MRNISDAGSCVSKPNHTLHRRMLSVAVSVALVSATASAATVQVATTGDTSSAATCTFRQAVTSINAAATTGTGCTATGVFGTADTITFAPSIVTIVLGDTANNSVNVTVNNDLTIQGTGMGGVTIERPSGASNKFGVLRASSTQCTLTLDGLTISNGYALASVGGGGVYAAASVIVQNSIVSGNSTRNPGSGTTHGGGISAYAVTLSNSTVSGNSEFGFGTGGGIYATNVSLTDSTVSGNSAYGSGGGVYAKKQVTLSYSVVSDNTGQAGAGILAPTVDLTGSTVSGNTASGYGGGISGVTTMVSSTVSGNSAKGGGGINAYIATITNSTVSGNTGVNYAGGIFGTTLTLLNSTVTNNTTTAGTGAGLSLGYLEGVPKLSMISSIVSQNGTAGGTFDIATRRSFTPTGTNNLLGTTSPTIVLSSLSNGVSGNPLLESLANNGGPTMTHALQPGSPAIHAGANPQDLTTDQRGTGFARETNGATDIGAFELPDLIFANGFELP
jgi:predicted outer membrane repeat protein